MAGGSPIAFYERVEVIAPAADEPELRGRHGWVVGVSSDDATGVVHAYFVIFDDLEHGYTLAPEQLRGTGEVAPRSRFYDDAAVVRVVVDEDGRGVLG